jgi:V/A-type H+-transporting ATPase subunit I
MLQPQAMCRVELVVPDQKVIPVTEAIANLGVFHQVDASYMKSQDTTHPAGYWQDQIAAFTTLERKILDLMQALDIREDELPPSKEVHSAPPDIVRIDLEKLEQETQVYIQELEQERQKLDQYRDYVQHLEPLRDLAVDMETLRSLRYVFLLLGTIPTHKVNRLETSLSRIPSVMLVLRRDENMTVLALFGNQQDAEILERAARSAYFNRIDLPDLYNGTPADTLRTLDEEIERAQQRIHECETEIKKLHQIHLDQFRAMLWQVRAGRAIANAILRFGHLHYTYLIYGWVPKQQVERLRKRLERVSKEILIEVRDPDRQETEDEVPTTIRSPRFLNGFQQLVTTYGTPRYKELDPTPLLAITFPLIFGIMFGDVGHGLVLSLLGFLISSGKVHSLRTMQGLGSIIAICGLTSMLAGFLYGSVFGFENILSPIWLRPLENITEILLATVGLGIVLLNVGFLSNLLNAYRMRDWGRLLFSANGLAGIMLYWSLMGLIASFFMTGFPLSTSILAATGLLGAAGVALSEPLGRILQHQRTLMPEGIGAYLTQAIFELFETIISFVSNSLSYVRMGAFAVAHGGLSAVVFIIAGLLGSSHSAGYWLVMFIGNLVIIGFEGFIVGIQTVRLEYYEFFGKFFTGGGKFFHPLVAIEDVKSRGATS